MAFTKARGSLFPPSRAMGVVAGLGLGLSQIDTVCIVRLFLGYFPLCELRDRVLLSVSIGGFGCLLVSVSAAFKFISGAHSRNSCRTRCVLDALFQLQFRELFPPNAIVNDGAQRVVPCTTGCAVGSRLSPIAKHLGKLS